MTRSVSIYGAKMGSGGAAGRSASNSAAHHNAKKLGKKAKKGGQKKYATYEDALRAAGLK